MNNRRLTKGRFGLRAWCCLARDAFRFPDDGGFDIFEESSLHRDDAVTAKRVATFRIRAETKTVSLSLSLLSATMRVFLKATRRQKKTVVKVVKVSLVYRGLILYRFWISKPKEKW